jgi:hypothetical protein
MRTGLLSIEPLDNPGESSSSDLHQAYQHLLAQMDELITELEHRSR